MIDEPDIVKQLREEERIGKLSYDHFDLKDKIFGKIGIKPKETLNNYSNMKITSYKDSLNIAKKVLKDLNKK